MMRSPRTLWLTSVAPQRAATRPHSDEDRRAPGCRKGTAPADRVGDVSATNAEHVAERAVHTACGRRRGRTRAPIASIIGVDVSRPCRSTSLMSDQMRRPRHPDAMIAPGLWPQPHRSRPAGRTRQRGNACSTVRGTCPNEARVSFRTSADPSSGRQKNHLYANNL